MGRVITISFVVLLISAAITPAAAQDSEPTVIRQFMETSYYFDDVTFVSEDVGWAVGDPHWDQGSKQYVGTILKTTDGGVTWTPQNAGVDAALHGVWFVDANQGWAVGDRGTILHTADGGVTWTPQPVDTDENFRAVTFIDAVTGWVTATTPSQVDDFLGDTIDWQAAIYHTTDGGTTWTPQAIPAEVSILNRIDFVDAQTGWTVGTRRVESNTSRPDHFAAIYHTTDGGQTWVEQLGLNESITLTAVDFIDAINGWTAGFPTRSSVQGGMVFHTADGGVTWERQEAGGFMNLLQDIEFVDENRGYLVGADYVGAWGPPVFRTLDGGATWKKIAMDRHDNDGLYGLSVIGDRVVALGDHDYVVTSEIAWGTYEWPHGENLFTQRYLTSHYHLEDVFFADEAHGWAVGRRAYAPSMWGQVILHTNDGGETWEVQYEHAPPDSLFSIHRLASVYFVDTQTGWAVGKAETYRGDAGWEHAGAILSTTDGGQTWHEIGPDLYQGRDREFFAVQFLNAQEGWALAAGFFPSNNIHLAHTTDGGQTWNWVDTGNEGTLAVGFAEVQGDVFFVDALHGWAGGGNGMIVYTADGGATWTPQTLACGHPTCPYHVRSFAFIDAQSGWMAGEGLYRTIDGGVSWLSQEIDHEHGLKAIQFVDDQTGWIAGERGGLLVTHDGGSQWTAVESGTGFALGGLHFLRPDRGWIVGDYGIILRVGN